MFIKGIILCIFLADYLKHYTSPLKRYSIYLVQKQIELQFYKYQKWKRRPELIKGTLKKYLKNFFYAIQCEMEKFLETYNLPKMNQEQIENSNRSLLVETESADNSPQQKKKPRTTWLHWCEFTKHSKKLASILLKLFAKNQRGGTSNILWGSEKDTIENYRPISLMNIDTNILPLKLLANWIHQYTKRIIYYDQKINPSNTITVINHISKWKEKNSYDHLNGHRKIFDKMQHPLIKTHTRNRINMFFNIVKSIYDKPTANVMFSHWSWRLFL